MRELIYTAKLEIENRNISQIKTLRYGEQYIYESYSNLLKLLNIVEEEYNNKKRGFKECLSSKEISLIKDKIMKMVGNLYSGNRYRDNPFNDAGRNLWISKHPTCVSYQDWEKWSYYLCDRLNINFEIKRVTCDFTLELTRKIIPCNILVYIQAHKQACNLGIKLDVEKERCKAELKILKDESKCDLSLKTYIDLKKCNISFDMVKEVYSCGLKLKTQAEKVTLVTDLNEYALDCINPQSLQPLAELNQHPTVNIQDILNNYQ